MTSLCQIPNCPAIPELNRPLCRLHSLARTAQALGLSGNGTGAGAKHCLLCERGFKPYEWVLIAPQRRDLTKTGRKVTLDPIGHVHVACAPRVRKVSKQKGRAAAKPLLSDKILGLEQ
jgi:hypothetical protein